MYLLVEYQGYCRTATFRLKNTVLRRQNVKTLFRVLSRCVWYGNLQLVLHILNINSQALVEKILNEIELKLDAQLMNLSNLIIAQDELGVIESKVEERVVYYTNDNVNNNWPNIETSGIKTARLKELDRLRFMYKT